MVSVAIIAILATISIIATTRVRLKSRDIKRISNATEIVSALEAYYAANQSYPTMIFPGQPIASNGREYLRAVPSNPSPRTDGGCADSDYTYITTTTGYKLTFCIGSDNSRFAQGIVICKNGNCGIKDDCSGEITDSEGTRYPIVRIGDQCWMATHLKSKKRPDGACVNVQESSTYPVDPVSCVTAYSGSVYGGFGGCPTACVAGSRRDCIKISGPILSGNGWNNRGFDISSVYDYPPGVTSACNNRGALYTWAAAMNLDNSCLGTACISQISTPRHRGICPVDWHIPSDQEFYALELGLTDSPNNCDINRNSHVLGFDSCRNAGTKLVVGGSSLFNAILLGIRENYDGTAFSAIDQSVHFWSATNAPTGYEAISRIIDVGVSGIYRKYESKDSAFAVRCIRDY